MRNTLEMPTKDELAELSHAELNERTQMAFYQWLDAMKQGENTADTKAIHRAYDHELLNRLHRIKTYLKQSS